MISISSYNDILTVLTERIEPLYNLSKTVILSLTPVQAILAVMITMFIIIISVIINIFITRFSTWIERKRRSRLTCILKNYMLGNEEVRSTRFLKRHRLLFFHEYVRLKETVRVGDDIQRDIIELFIKLKIDRLLLKNLRSWNHDKKVKATILLSHLPVKKLFEIITKVFNKEKQYHMKVYLAYALGRLRDSRAIPVIIDSLPGAPDWYCQKIYGILITFSDELLVYLEYHSKTDVPEIMGLIRYGAMRIPSPLLKVFLLKMAHNTDETVSLEAAKALRPLYYQELDSPYFLEHHNPKIRSEAIRAISRYNATKKFIECINYLKDPLVKDDAVFSMTTILQRNPGLFNELVNRFFNETNLAVLQGLAEVASNRIEYLLVKMKGDNEGRYKRIIYMILSFGYITGAVAFLNKNRDKELEKRVIETMKLVLIERPDLKPALAESLDERFHELLDIDESETRKSAPRVEKVKLQHLYAFLLIGLLTFPLLFFITFWDDLATITLSNLFSRYFYVFNYYFAFYAMALNTIYLLLMLLSLKEKNKQKRRWSSKYLSMLFAPEILPSISIIAPAYGEEATIIQSVSSLLNLRYPDYEVIVVNDGSKDNTLQVLLDHFKLEKTDFIVDWNLQTSPVRGFYFNSDYPRLKVIDKVNGGKADSLNAGINLARSEYFCGIDADSLLEDDALLKIASTFLDSEYPVIAAGGNIVPINGCDVDRGAITKVGIPKNFLARLQTLEYFRSFLSGRLGWSAMKLLLIISGAFGVFRRREVINARGYLTSKEFYKKDTVGEDMELVVRLVRQQKEEKKPAIIHYAYNANCWTEVPESWNILYKQRDRWHRGLLDIITFHFKMMGSPRYGLIGMVALPYFLIFEVIGPWIELQGYIIFFTSLALGLLDPAIILLLLATTMVYGILLSVLSIFIVETGIGLFRFRDLMKILLFSVWENFGLRQVLSMIRVAGFINALKQKSGWGTMIRKGFEDKKPAAG